MKALTIISALLCCLSFLIPPQASADTAQLRSYLKQLEQLPIVVNLKPNGEFGEYMGSGKMFTTERGIHCTVEELYDGGLPQRISCWARQLPGNKKINTIGYTYGVFSESHFHSDPNTLTTDQQDDHGQFEDITYTKKDFPILSPGQSIALEDTTSRAKVTTSCGVTAYGTVICYVEHVFDNINKYLDADSVHNYINFKPQRYNEPVIQNATTSPATLTRNIYMIFAITPTSIIHGIVEEKL